ncbi:hypothetical protein HPULCUR_005629 [Helicostylum pulchrum]|uniref:SWIM-type domain-containing protein n=1 Tax=Helicostylum pulchrum TaxID=562976 RepID=A0ABP9XZL8_9FUNG
MLSQIVILDYRQEALKVAINVQAATFIIYEVEDTPGFFSCQSFDPDSDNIYQISVGNNHVRFCSCPDSIGICKHMFLVSRIMKIPFSVRKIVTIAREPVVNNRTDDKSSYISAYAENGEEYCACSKKTSRELQLADYVFVSDMDNQLQSLRDSLARPTRQTSTTTQFTLDRFKFHLELYNHYQVLGEIYIDIQDYRKYPDLPQQNQVVNSLDIDVGCSHRKVRKKLERAKKHTEEEKEVSKVEDVLSKSPVTVNNTALSQYQNAFNLHASKSDQLQKFYSSKKRASLLIANESQKRRFLDKLIGKRSLNSLETEEQEWEVESKDTVDMEGSGCK